MILAVISALCLAELLIVEQELKNRILLVLFGCCVLAVVLLIFYLYDVLISAYKKLEEQNMLSQATINHIPGGYHRCSLEESNRILNERNRILSALSRDYTTILLCDLKQDTFEVVKGDTFTHNDPEEKQQLVRGSNCYSERVRYFFENVLIKDSAPEYLERLLPEYLMEELKEKDSIEIYHKTVPNGSGSRHFLAKAVRLYNEEDHFKIILGFHSVDEIMKKEQELELQREIIEGLGKEYFSVLAVELDKDRVFSYRESGKNGKIISDFCRKCGNRWSKIIPSYAETMVSDNTNGEFEKQLGLEVLRSQEEDYSMTYEFKSETGINYHQVRVAYVKKKDGTRMAVVGTRNIDSLIKKERMQEEELKKAYAAAENASRAKTEFLSNMSHDIRTPMNAIVGLTAIAGANIESQDRVVECLGKITKSSRHLLGLINEVLDMARIESGRMSLAEEDFSLPELVDNLLTLTKPAIDEHKHQLEVHVEHIEHEAVCGDSLRIQQIFVNLMSNAVKYTPDGGNITLTIKEKPNGFSELGCYEFSIEDNGIGMTPEFQKIMFEPFSRADDHRTTKVQGTGLGMAIARNIVNLMNGDIQVESAPNKGTKITVTVYLKLQENEKEQEKGLLDLPVLVVDDDQTCCESTVATLKEIGIAGEWVLTGKEAVERCYAHHETNNDYFAVILDWKMPEMDGIATARKIQERVGEEVTIIILTSFDFSEIEEEARAAGVDAFMAKPLFRSRLTATLRQLTSGKREKNARNYLEDFASENYAGKRILLVEDNELNREIATEIIGMTGVTIDSAENGKIAVEKVMEAPEKWYDLIFMDIQMPIMNGYEATAAIRALAGSRGKVPIIAMTANAFAEDVQLAKNTGMNEHIAKPLDLNKLNDVLKQWL